MLNTDKLREGISAGLKKARIDAGISATEAAQALGKCKNTIYSWEIGRILPTADMLLQAMLLYGIKDFTVFLQNDDESESSTPTHTEDAKASDLTPAQSEMLSLMEQSNEQGISAARAVLMTFKR